MPGAALQRDRGTVRPFCGSRNRDQIHTGKIPLCRSAERRCCRRRVVSRAVLSCWQGSASKERPVERVSETDLQSTWRLENAQRNRRFPQKMLEACMCLTRVKGLSGQRPSDPTEGDSVLPGGASRGGHRRCHVLVLAEVNNENKTKYIQKMQDLFLFIYLSAT